MRKPVDEGGSFMDNKELIKIHKEVCRIHLWRTSLLRQCQQALALVRAPEDLNGAIVCFYGTPGVPGGESIIGEEPSRMGFSGSSFPLAVTMLRTVRLIL